MILLHVVIFACLAVALLWNPEDCDCSECRPRTPEPK